MRQSVLQNVHIQINMFMLSKCTGWHKKTGNFQKPDKNWRNPRKKLL